MMEKIVFMGTPDFAAVILQGLLDAGCHIQAVFTQPDKAKGRSGKLQPPPVKELALKEGIEVYQPVRIREQENVRILEQLSPDVIVVAAFGQIIPKNILELPRFGCVNVHASLLPKYRGAAPIQWAIMDGEEETGVTIMQMGVGLDTGDILRMRSIPIAPTETGGSLFDRLSTLGAELLVETLGALERGEITPQPQPEESPTPYASMLKRSTGQIRWEDRAEHIERMVRALDPWPTAFTYLRGKQLKIWESQVVDESREKTDAQIGTGLPERMDTQAGPGAEEDKCHPGCVLRTGKSWFDVQTGDGILRVTQVQLEGKKRMDVEAFLRGNQVEGEQLG